MPAHVIVLAGPSGSGKSRLSKRLGLPVLNLDDFYKNGSDPTLPRRADGAVDWDDPQSWLHQDALSAIEELCRYGESEVPLYDIGRDGRVGQRCLRLDGTACFIAEGIFAQEVVAECRTRGLLADAICVRHHRLVTFWRRLTRDLREHRKPPHLLISRGLRLMCEEPQVVAHAVELGCVPMRPEQAYRRLVTRPGSRSPA